MHGKKGFFFGKTKNGKWSWEASLEEKKRKNLSDGRFPKRVAWEREGGYFRDGMEGVSREDIKGRLRGEEMGGPGREV